MTVDLSKINRGDKVTLRCGAELIVSHTDNGDHGIEIYFKDHRYGNGVPYNKDGRFNRVSVKYKRNKLLPQETHPFDIIKIPNMEINYKVEMEDNIIYVYNIKAGNIEEAYEKAEEIRQGYILNDTIKNEFTHKRSNVRVANVKKRD